MKSLHFLLILIIVISCVKEQPTIITELLDGTAKLDFHGRSFQLKSLKLVTPANPSAHRWAMDIEGVFDSKDNFSLLIDSLNLDVPGKNTLRKDNIRGFLADGDVIYGFYELIDNDDFDDYLTLDSLSATKAYYSAQLNILDSNFTPVNDTIWIKGTMEVNLPEK